MMTVHFDLDTVRNDLKKIAAEKPDHVNEPDAMAGSCVYFDTDGSPSCIVGNMFAMHGVDVDDFTHINSQGVRSIGHHIPNITFSEEGLYYAEAVQDYQDGGIPWGKAVELADESLGHTS